MNTKIGDRLLLNFKMNPGWNKKDLYNTLIDEIGSKVSPMDQKKYGKFFLKIRGYYDKAIIQNEQECDACPYNYIYKAYNDYNVLRDEKEPVLVLSSKYVNFKEYDIYAAYFTDKAELNSENIELWGMDTGVWYYFMKFLGFRR